MSSEGMEATKEEFSNFVEEMEEEESAIDDSDSGGEVGFSA